MADAPPRSTSRMGPAVGLVRGLASSLARRSLLAAMLGLACDAGGDTTLVVAAEAEIGDDVGQIATEAPSPERWVGKAHARAIAAATDDGDAGCAAYCRAFGTTCGASPFADLSSCTARCAAWPAGADDETGDTLACRTALLTGAGSCIGASPDSPICRAPRVAHARGRAPRAAAL